MARCAWIRLVWLAVLAGALAGCAGGQPHDDLGPLIDAGQWGRARSLLNHTLEDHPDNTQSEILDLMHLQAVDLADGLGPPSEVVANRLFELLRTRGVNANTKLAATVLHEGVRVFKGEPFEQAYAYQTIAMQKGTQADWGNVRAAALASLDLLDEFDAMRAQHTHIHRGDQPRYEYAIQQADFPLAYFMAAAANRALGRPDEARDYARHAADLRPELRPVARQIVDSPMNMLLVVEAGRGPIKIAQGTDKTFRWRTPSDHMPLTVAINDHPARSYPIAADLNRLAGVYVWDALRSIRGAKQTLGEGLVIGGAVVATQSDDDETQLAGLAMILAGLVTQASAAPDLRQVQTLPQRVYLVPIRIEQPGTRITLAIRDHPGSTMILPAVDPLPAGTMQLAVVRLVDSRLSPVWADSGTIVYTNDAHRAAQPVRSLPYILGGFDVRTPTHAVLADYQAAGYLKGMTLADLQELYRAEGIKRSLETAGGRMGLHILEGGTWLFTPDPASAGYARLFSSLHRPYRPRSRQVSELADRIARDIEQGVLPPVLQSARPNDHTQGDTQ